MADSTAPLSGEQDGVKPLTQKEIEDTVQWRFAGVLAPYPLQSDRDLSVEVGIGALRVVLNNVRSTAELTAPTIKAWCEDCGQYQIVRVDPDGSEYSCGTCARIIVTLEAPSPAERAGTPERPELERALQRVERYRNERAWMMHGREVVLIADECARLRDVEHQLTEARARIAELEPARREMDDANAVLKAENIGWIYDEFRDLPDALRQMIAHVDSDRRYTAALEAAHALAVKEIEALRADIDVARLAAPAVSSPEDETRMTGDGGYGT